jgi:hypothetical protein
MKTRVGVAGAAICLLLVGACGSDNSSDSGERGTAVPRSLGKADGTMSCQGICGDQAPGGCWCDELCEKYDDCCPDKVAVCDEKTPSCEGYCGEKSTDGCWCDELCAQYGDCCPDKATVCDGGTTTPECEVQGGYCANFLDPCDPGYTDAPSMGCPMGKSGKCCLPQATCSDNSDCADGEYCHFDDGECLLNTTAPITGTCEERPTNCVHLYKPVCGCDGTTYSNDCHAHAAGTSVGHSGPCKDPCWGAWLDQWGNCRSPNDGTYPDECCADERATKCKGINAEYAEVVTQAKSCVLSPTFAPQCTIPVPESLVPCSSVCTTYINTQPAALSAHVDDWKQLDCDKVPWICFAYACPPPSGASCEDNGDGTATCVDVP